MSDWITFVNCYRNVPENSGKTMNTCMMEAKKLWADPEIKASFIRSMTQDEKDEVPPAKKGKKELKSRVVMMNLLQLGSRGRR